MEDKSSLEDNYFSWSGWDQHDIMVFGFYDVIFKVDFGVFKKGEEFKCITLSYEEGYIEAYNEDGTKVVKTQRFGLNPIGA